MSPRACCQLLQELTLEEFMQIDRLDEDLAWVFSGMDADNVDVDGDGYISTDDFFRILPDDFFLTRAHAQLTVMMADRDGDGKLSMAEMQTLIDSSYMDDAMTLELSAD
jgi:Ca2+-binding EF-hand superfamily protein